MVAVADPDGVADIFRSSRGYLKGPLYDSLLRSFFATRDPVFHGQRRRLFARPLANSSLQAFWAHDIRERVTLAVRRIKEDAEVNGEGDAYKWWNIMANDVITRLSFGESLNLLESDEVGHPFVAVETISDLMLAFALYRSCEENIEMFFA
jgi:cytochrome P450